MSGPDVKPAIIWAVLANVFVAAGACTDYTFPAREFVIDVTRLLGQQRRLSLPSRAVAAILRQP